MVFLLLFLCCLSFPCVAKELPVKITGKPNPQILATEAWRALREIGFVRGTPPPRYQMNAYYDEPNRFRLDILLPEGNQCLMAHHFFDRRHGRWYLSVEDKDYLNPQNINPRHRDYLSHMLDFYEAPTAFPLIVEPVRAREAYQLLLDAAATEQWRIQPDPSLKFRNPDVPIRDEPRTKEAYLAAVSRFRAEAQYVGLTKVSEIDEVVWVQAEDRYSLFLVRTIRGDRVITDWYTNVRTVDQPQAWRRVCTVPVHQAATGGRLTLGQLIEQQPQAQALLRMFRLAAMQNLNEVMSYCAGSISSKDRQQWWPNFYQAAKNTTNFLELPIEPLAGDRYLVRYVTPTGTQALQCKVFNARLQVTALNDSAIVGTKPAPQSNCDRAIILVRRAIKQVDQQGGMSYFYLNRNDYSAQGRNFSQFRAWVNDRWEGDRVLYLESHVSTIAQHLVVTEHRGTEYRTVWFGLTPGLTHINDIFIEQALPGRYGIIKPYTKEVIDAFVHGLEKKGEVKALRYMQL